MKKQKDFEQRRIEKKKGRLEEMKAQLEALGSRVEIDWKTGSAAKQIVARCDQENSTLVVMGNHGKGFFREALLGSVANEVVRRVEVPVLLVPSFDAMGDAPAASSSARPKGGISQS